MPARWIAVPSSPFRCSPAQLALAAAARPACRRSSRRPASSARRPDAVPVPEPDAKALAYYRSGNVLWGWASVRRRLPAAPARHRLLGADALARRAHLEALGRRGGRLRRLLPRARLAGRRGHSATTAGTSARTPTACRTRPSASGCATARSTSACRRWWASCWRSASTRGSAARRGAGGSAPRPA